MNTDNLIYETENFTLERHPKPFVCRTEGGHMRIFPKDHNISERREFSPKQAMEFVKLSMIAGEALEKAMNDRGIPVVRINYEDLGNWAFKRGERPVLHLHIFGRSKNAIKQKFPEAVYLPDRSTGFYDEFEPLTDEDIKIIRSKIEEISELPKYKNEKW